MKKINSLGYWTVPILRLCLLVSVVYCATLAGAQKTTTNEADYAQGTMRGMVTDPVGAELEGATIVVLNWQGEKPMQSLARTDNHGEYSIQLKPGIYDVVITYPSLEPFAKKVRIEAGKKYVVNGKLRFSAVIGNVEQIH